MNLTSQEVIQLLSDERKTRSDPPSPGPSTLTSDALTHAEQAERLFRGGDRARFERLLVSLTLNGKVQTLLSVTSILHAVVISPSSTEEVPCVQLCYSELENATEEGG